MLFYDLIFRKIEKEKIKLERVITKVTGIRLWEDFGIYE